MTAPTLNAIEQSAGERLEATREFRESVGVNVQDHPWTFNENAHNAVDELLALIMRLVGELADEERWHKEDQQRAEQAEADLAAMTAERVALKRPVSAPKWISDDFTHMATYLPEFGAVRYSYPSTDDDGAPIFRSCLIDREAAEAILFMFTLEDE